MKDLRNEGSVNRSRRLRLGSSALAVHTRRMLCRVGLLVLVGLSLFCAAEGIMAQAPLVPNTAIEALPRGTVEFDGVQFEVKRFNIIGTRAARAQGSYPGSVSVPVARLGRKIHLLHCADHGVSDRGEYIWRLVLHYQNGEQRLFDFAYGVDILNWWRRPNDEIKEISGPDSIATWTGHSVESDRRGAELQVYRTTLANPLPDEEVVSADYVTMFGQSSAYVLSLAISDEGPEPHERNDHRAAGPSITFKLVNDHGEPLPDATVRFDAEGDGFRIRFGELHCDKHGRIELPLPKPPVRILRYNARGAGVARSGTIEIGANDRQSREETITLEGK